MAVLSAMNKKCKPNSNKISCKLANKKQSKVALTLRIRRVYLMPKSYHFLFELLHQLPFAPLTRVHFA